MLAKVLESINSFRILQKTNSKTSWIGIGTRHIYGQLNMMHNDLTQNSDFSLFRKFQVQLFWAFRKLKLSFQDWKILAFLNAVSKILGTLAFFPKHLGNQKKFENLSAPQSGGPKIEGRCSNIQKFQPTFLPNRYVTEITRWVGCPRLRNGGRNIFVCGWVGVVGLHYK